MLSAPRARARLQALSINHRGELAWQLLETGECAQGCPEALVLLALAGCAGWLDDRTIEMWLDRLAMVWEGHADRLSAAGPWPGGAARVWRARAVLAPVLGATPEKACDWPDVSEFLARVWAIHERDELIRMLLWLGGQGHRYGWDLDYQRVSRMSTAERLKWRAGLGDHEAYGRLMLQFIARDEPADWAAWDWLRLVDLAFAGRLMGWLDEQEAIDFAVHGVDLLCRRYDDWATIARAWQRGRSLFEGRDLTGVCDEAWSLLLHGVHSPWRLAPGALVDEAMLLASRRRIRCWRQGARNWVLTIAAVREPELLYRQGPVAPLEEARIRDARHYLSETLDWTPEAGVEAITRFWLPGQVHHLNQLASDAAHHRLPPVDIGFGRPADELVKQRDRLADCVPFTATITMAEKFAFYLTMLEDADVAETTALERLKRSLAGVLGRFYASPDQLLSAWLAWESVLPESSETSLADDLRWHLGDEGSPFHWLATIGGEWQEPGPRPTLGRFTALALAGPLNTPIWGEPACQNSEQDNEQGREVREWLDSHYAISSAEGLGDFLDFLGEVGDRQEYQINYAPYTLNRARLDEEIAILETGRCSEDEQVHLDRLRRVRDNDQGCNDIDMAAWDIAQLVDLSVAGVQLGWLDRTRLEHYLERACALAGEHYGDWASYAHGLYTGYSFFMMEAPERDRFLAELCNALSMWLSGAPPLAGSWASLDFPGTPPSHWPALHVDMLPGDRRRLH